MEKNIQSEDNTVKISYNDQTHLITVVVFEKNFEKKKSLYVNIDQIDPFIEVMTLFVDSLKHNPIS